MSRILKAINEINMIKPVAAVPPIKGPTNPGTNVQTQRAVEPVSSTDKTSNSTTQQQDPSTQAANFSDQLEKLLKNAGLRSELNKLLAKA